MDLKDHEPDKQNCKILRWIFGAHTEILFLQGLAEFLENENCIIFILSPENKMHVISLYEKRRYIEGIKKVRRFMGHRIKRGESF